MLKLLIVVGCFFYLSESATIPSSPSKIQQVAQVQVARNPSNQDCQITIGPEPSFFLEALFILPYLYFLVQHVIDTVGGVAV